MFATNSVSKPHCAKTSIHVANRLNVTIAMTGCGNKKPRQQKKTTTEKTQSIVSDCIEDGCTEHYIVHKIRQSQQL